MTVLGFTPCRQCQVPVLDVIAYKTGGLCPAHHREHVARRIEAIELRGKGLRVPIPLHKPKSEWEQGETARKNAQRRKDPVARRKEHLRERAKQRAYRRLRSLFPDVFDILVAQERERVGLPAWSVDMALTPGTADETLRMVESYHADDGAAPGRDPAPGDTNEAATGQ